MSRGLSGKLPDHDRTGYHKKPYPNDLSDAEWQKNEPLIPKPRTNRGRKRKHPVQEILNAIPVCTEVKVL